MPVWTAITLEAELWFEGRNNSQGVWVTCPEWQEMPDSNCGATVTGYTVGRRVLVKELGRRSKRKDRR